MGKDSTTAVSSKLTSRSPGNEALARAREERPVSIEPGEGASRWLNRNVVGMGLTSFLSNASHEVATAVFPLFTAAATNVPAIEFSYAAVLSLLGASVLPVLRNRRPKLVAF